MSPELLKLYLIKNYIIFFDKLKSNIFSIGFIILKALLILN